MTNPTPSATPPDDIERQLEHLFEGLEPHIEAHRELDRQLNERFAHRFNPLFYLRTNETALSALIAGLLDPGGTHGQGPLFLNRLLENIKLPDKLTLSKWTGGSPARVRTEWPDRIDISVELTDREGTVRCLAFENKPYAGDQSAQIKRYAEHLSKSYGGEFRLIYLTPHGTPPSEWSVDESTRQKLGERLLRMSYVEAPKLDDDELESDDTDSTTARDVSENANPLIDLSLRDWLEQCRARCDVERLRSFLREAQDFVEQRFGGKRMATENDVVRKFLIAHPQYLEAARAVTECGFERTIRSDFMKEIGNAVKERLSARNAEGDLNVWTDGGVRRDWEWHVRIGRAAWKTYRGKTPRPSDDRKTAVRLENAGQEWLLGVSYGTPEGRAGADAQLFEKLRADLENLLNDARIEDERTYKVDPTEWWPWAIRFSAPRFDLKELVDRSPEVGDFKEAIVDKLYRIAEVAIPVIEDSQTR